MVPSSDSRKDNPIAILLQRAPDEIHGRVQELGDKHIGGLVIKRQRCPVLLNDAFVHDDDSSAQRHRFDRIVRGINHRGLQTLMQFHDLVAHPRSCFRVERRKSPIEEKRLGLKGDGAGDRDALALFAGKGFRFALQ